MQCSYSSEMTDKLQLTAIHVSCAWLIHSYHLLHHSLFETTHVDSFTKLMLSCLSSVAERAKEKPRQQHCDLLYIGKQSQMVDR